MSLRDRWPFCIRDRATTPARAEQGPLVNLMLLW
jgi:hypothetical protein